MINVDDQFVVAKPFRFSGRDYSQGEAFAPKVADCGDRRLRQLHEHRFLKTSYEWEQTKGRRAVAPRPQPEGVAKDGVKGPRRKAKA